MPRIVRCGLIQASNALPPTDKQTSLEAIKSATEKLGSKPARSVS